MTTQTKVRSTAEALKLALEALEEVKSWKIPTKWDGCFDKEIAAIKTVLANNLKPKCFAGFQSNHEHDRKCQWCAVEVECKTGVAQPEQEPVAIVEASWNNDEGFMLVKRLAEKLPKGSHLYTTPPQRKPLTDEQIDEGRRHPWGTSFLDAFKAGVRFAESAHSIKE